MACTQLGPQACIHANVFKKYVRKLYLCTMNSNASTYPSSKLMKFVQDSNSCFMHFQAEAATNLEAEKKKFSQYSSEKEEMQGTDCLFIHSLPLNILLLYSRHSRQASFRHRRVQEKPVSLVWALHILACYNYTYDYRKKCEDAKGASAKVGKNL